MFIYIEYKKLTVPDLNACPYYEKSFYKLTFSTQGQYYAEMGKAKKNKKWHNFRPKKFADKICAKALKIVQKRAKIPKLHKNSKNL